MQDLKNQLRDLKKETQDMWDRFESVRKEKEILMKNLGISKKQVKSFQDRLSPEEKKIYLDKKQELVSSIKTTNHNEERTPKTKGSRLKKDWV